MSANNAWQELSTSDQRAALDQHARDQRWNWAFALIGWLHLAAFSLCYWLTVHEYHESAGYLLIWASELGGVWLIFRMCAGRRATEEMPPLGRFVVRVWLSYFLLAFNLGTLNTLRGHPMFEFFPATATLASFAFLVMTFAVHRRFFAAVVIMFCSGLLMASNFVHAYLIFAVAWWLVLNGLGLALALRRDEAREEIPILPLRAFSPSSNTASVDRVASHFDI